jgi:hypothetical protein
MSCCLSTGTGAEAALSFTPTDIPAIAIHSLRRQPCWCNGCEHQSGDKMAVHQVGCITDWHQLCITCQLSRSAHYWRRFDLGSSLVRARDLLVSE